MEHPIHRVKGVEVLEGYRLRVTFDDGLQREIDLEEILEGELYGPLRVCFAKISSAFRFSHLRIIEKHAYILPGDTDPGMIDP